MNSFMCFLFLFSWMESIYIMCVCVCTENRTMIEDIDNEQKQNETKIIMSEKEKNLEKLNEMMQIT